MLFPESLKRVVETYLRQASPGLYYSLDTACLKQKGKPCLELLISQPADFRDVLFKIYGDESSIRLVVRLILHPILTRSDSGTLIEDYLKLFLASPVEFQKKLRELITQS